MNEIFLANYRSPLLWTLTARSSKICSPIKEKFKHPATHDFVILPEVNRTLNNWKEFPT